MRNLTRTPLLVGVTGAALAAAVAIPVARSRAVGADEAPRPEPDAVTSMNAQLIYGAVGRVPPLEPPVLTIPPILGIAFSEEDQMWLDYQRRENERRMAEWRKAFAGSKKRILDLFPGAALEAGRKSDPLFANWKAENGSGTVESPGGQSSSTSPAEGVHYDVDVSSNGGTINAQYGAKARIQGTTTDIAGSYRFTSTNGGDVFGTGNLAFESNLRLFSEGLNLKLSGIASITGNKTYNVSIGATSFTFGMTGAVKNGPQYSVSAAVSADGQVLGFSLGGEASIPGIPDPIKLRVDLAPGSVEVGASPAPGITLSSSSDGSFSVKVDLKTFGPWFQKAASGK